MFVYFTQNAALNLDALFFREIPNCNFIRIANCQNPNLISLVFYDRKYRYLPNTDANRQLILQELNIVI
jgi:hypothetical protein